MEGTAELGCRQARIEVEPVLEPSHAPEETQCPSTAAEPAVLRRLLKVEGRWQRSLQSIRRCVQASQDGRAREAATRTTSRPPQTSTVRAHATAKKILPGSRRSPASESHRRPGA